MSDNQMELQERLMHHFANPELLRKALTHPSFAAEQKHPTLHNQRLEFLGDAVMQHVITELVFFEYPDYQEGALSKIRSALTNERALVGRARELDLGQFLLLGNGEEQSGGRERDSNLADAFEAVLGAMYLDGGLEIVTAFLRRLNLKFLKDPESLLEAENPKGALQELAQERFNTAPQYTLVSKSGPEHQPQFEIEVTIDQVSYGRAVSSSRKGAEKEAAVLALHQLMTDPRGGGV